LIWKDINYEDVIMSITRAHFKLPELCNLTTGAGKFDNIEICGSAPGGSLLPPTSQKVTITSIPSLRRSSSTTSTTNAVRILKGKRKRNVSIPSEIKKNDKTVHTVVKKVRTNRVLSRSFSEVTNAVEKRDLEALQEAKKDIGNLFLSWKDEFAKCPIADFNLWGVVQFIASPLVNSVISDLIREFSTDINHAESLEELRVAVEEYMETMELQKDRSELSVARRAKIAEGIFLIKGFLDRSCFQKKSIGSKEEIGVSEKKDKFIVEYEKWKKEFDLAPPCDSPTTSAFHAAFGGQIDAMISGVRKRFEKKVSTKAELIGFLRVYYVYLGRRKSYLSVARGTKIDEVREIMTRYIRASGGKVPTHTKLSVDT